MKTLAEKFLLLIFIIICLSSMSSLSAQDNCVLKKDKDNFKIYNCPIENTKFKSVMADFELNTTISEYVDVVLDVEK